MCPTYLPPDDTVHIDPPEPPVVGAVPCADDGDLTIPPDTAEVVYTSSPLYTGSPGTYTVTATAQEGHIFPGNERTITWSDLVVDPKVTGAACEQRISVTALAQTDLTGAARDTDGVLTITATEGVTYLIDGVTYLIDGVDVAAGDTFGPRIGDGAADCAATALAPRATAASCDAPGTLSVPEVEGISYSVVPRYESGGSGDYAVTAAARDGYVNDGPNTFLSTVPAQLSGAECDEVLSDVIVRSEWPSVRTATCAADGSLVLPTTEGVTYSVGHDGPGDHVVAALAPEGYRHSGPSSFSLTVRDLNGAGAAGRPPR